MIKIPKTNIYFWSLIYSYTITIINNNILSIGKVETIIGYCILILFTVLEKNYISFNSKEIVILLFLSCGQILGYIYSFNTEYSNNKFFKFIFFLISYILFCIVPWRKSYNKNDIVILLKFIFIMALISCIYSMLFQFGKDIFTFRNSYNYNISNVYSSFWGHRNQFGIIILSGIISNFFLIQKNNSIFLKITIIVFIFNLILTLSRTCYISLFVFFIIFLLGDWKKYKKILICLMFFGSIVLILYYKVEIFNYFINTYMIREKSGLTGRDTLWKIAINLLDIPTLIFGRGIGIDKIVLSNDTISAGVGFHNIYLTYLVSGGIILLSIIIFSIIRIIKKVLILVNNKTEKSWIIATIICFLVYVTFEASVFFGISNNVSIIQTLFVFTIPTMIINNNKNQQ